MARRAEHGQILILFMVVFSVILAAGAVAVDQGLWLAKRRVSQKDADVAARGGAIALALGRSAPMGDPAATPQAGCTAAGAVAGVNLVTAGNVDCTQATHCLSGSDGMPSVAVEIHRPTLGLFSRLPFLNGAVGGAVDARASAKACVGTTTRLRIGAAAPQALPIVMDARDSGPRSCFSGGTLVYGTECVIFGTANCGGSGDEHDGECDERTTVRAANYAITADPRRGCYTGANGDLRNATRNGTTFDCTIGTSRVRTSDASGSSSDAANARNAIFGGLQARLQANAPCARDAFHAAFGYADGYVAYANGPAAFARQDPSRPSDPGDTVYVQNACSPSTDPPLGDRRVAVLPIISSDADGDERVTGFAVVYITGCFQGASTTTSSGGGGGRGGRNAASSGAPYTLPATLNTCAAPGSSGNAGWEVRAVPLRLLMVGESLGDIRNTSENAPLTIQTVK